MTPAQSLGYAIMLLPATRIVAPVCDALCKSLATHVPLERPRCVAFSAANRHDLALQIVAYLRFAGELPAVAIDAHFAHLAIVSTMLRGVYGQPYSGAA